MTRPATRRHGIRLADGRELFYYDSADGGSADGPAHDAPDLRADLPAASTSSEMRWNPLFRDYAVIAGHRQARTYHPPADLCPLCPSRPGRSTEIPADDYQVVVFENRFPSFALQATETVPTVDQPPFKSGPGAGRCEVVCFTSDHGRSFSQLSPQHARTVIDAWADRTSALSALPSIDYVYCFENRGAEIGVTLSHPHGQIYGYPFVPPRFFRAVEACRRHRDRTGGCLQCALLAAELEAGDRIVDESEHWVGYVPFAARWPYEVRVVPRAHVPDLPSLSEPQRDDLARLYVSMLGRFDRLFDTPAPYIAGWQQAPVRLGRDLARMYVTMLGRFDRVFHTPAPYIAGWQQAPVRQGRDLWHLAVEIFTIRRAPGKLKYLAGSESGAAVWINDVTPELAADRLRAAGG